MTAKMFSSVDDFKQSVDKGIEVIAAWQEGPDQKDQEVMKSLLAGFITATMNPESFNDEKLITVRQALLAAYNLGKRSSEVSPEEKDGRAYME